MVDEKSSWGSSEILHIFALVVSTLSLSDRFPGPLMPNSVCIYSHAPSLLNYSM